MAEQYGITETTALLVCLNKTLVILAPAFKKGFNVADIIASLEKIEADAECKADFEAALAGIDQLPKEIGDLHWMEILTLALNQAKMVPSLIAAYSADK